MAANCLHPARFAVALTSEVRLNVSSLFSHAHRRLLDLLARKRPGLVTAPGMPRVPYSPRLGGFDPGWGINLMERWLFCIYLQRSRKSERDMPTGLVGMARRHSSFLDRL